ncbi:hypothetical protein PGT21_024654 [Puccinia graminis f. sp. tritici]|uniref:Uncharacterized protein n=1 Tax=Puccinia graminis f. sp. tritici TaxID=56615 RepID=A0A5B0QJF3_PUCGR|nr:hypothetical protein PGT21_024654 [Puccinia graminis f. sp. tritici]
MGYSPPALHYGQLAVAAPRSVTQTFRVKPNPHATSAAATTQSMKRQITLLESWLQLWSHHKLPTAARQAPPSTSPLGSTKKQPIEDYNQFALLVSSTYDPNQTVQLPETPEEKTGSYKEQRAAKIDHQSSSISPSTSALSSGGDSSGSSSPGLARSSSFYRRLFGPAALLEDNEHGEPARKKQAKAKIRDP